MTKRFIPIIAGLSVGCAVLIDISVVRNLPHLSVVVNLSLLSVLLVTCLEGLPIGLLAAGIVGVVFTQLSALPFGVHLGAFFGASFAAHLGVRRFFTTRSVLSLLVSVSLGTVTFYCIGILLPLLWRQIDQDTLFLPWRNILPAVLIQICTHPLLVWTWWTVRRSGIYTFVSETARNY